MFRSFSYTPFSLPFPSLLFSTPDVSFPLPAPPLALPGPPFPSLPHPSPYPTLLLLSPPCPSRLLSSPFPPCPPLDPQVTLIPTWLAICALAVALVVYSIIIPLWKRKQHWLTPEGQTSKVKFPFFVVTASAALGLFTLFLVRPVAYHRV